MPGRFDPIDHVLALDLGGRGIADFFTPGAALAAAESLLLLTWGAPTWPPTPPSARNVRGTAAAVLDKALRRAPTWPPTPPNARKRPGAAGSVLGDAPDTRRILIATGFTVDADTPETDGPPGAAALGRALALTGARVSYVTDAHNAPILEAALKAHDEPVAIEVYPEGDGHAAALLARARPTHLVAVERPGRARSGEYLNLRGARITEWNRRIDELFLVASRVAAPASTRRAAARPGSPRPITIGIGDGGNEIGMGNVRARLARLRSPLARIASVVRVDHLVVAGTSNWGAYGVVAALARLTGRDLLHDPGLEARVIEACVAAGAFDGVTRRREHTVDGLGAGVHAAVVHLLRVAAGSVR